MCGQRVIAGPDRPLASAQRGYVGFDSAIKALESRLGSITSNDGKIYAVRRALFASLPGDVTDDLFAALQVVAAGRRFVFEPAARAAIPAPARNPGHEVARRRRIVCQSLRGIWLLRRLLDPRRFGPFALGLAVNKVLRRLLPLFLLVFFLASLNLAPHSSLMALALAGQAGLVLLALLHPVLERLPAAPRAARKAASLAAYFLLGNLGALLGTADFLTGRRAGRWDPRKDDAAPPDGPPRIACLMSRFPKLTETFVLLEIVQLLDRGARMTVWPLIRMEEPAAHPEVERVRPLVRHLPFLSWAVLRAGLGVFLARPGRFLGTVARVLAGTARSRDHFLKTLALLPKAAAWAAQARAEGIEHLHAHFATHPAMAAYIVHRLAGAPFSFTAHAHDIQMDRTMLAAKMEAAAFVVAISDYNRRFLAALAPHLADKIRVVRCGVDPAYFTPAPEPPAERPFRMLCVASFKDMKGHGVLVEACRLLKARGVDLALDLAGDGPLREEVAARIAAAGLSREVRILGPLPRPEVAELLRRSHAAVLASVVGRRGDHDGIPVFLMEAMACGLPVASTRLSGIPELVEHGVSGLLVPPGDAPALAAALESLAADPELRRRMGREGRRKVEAEYDQAANAAKLAGLVEEVVAARRAARGGRP
ncbi:MAG: glycosyltransferase [Thermodesulfobacteriota bacterium]